MVWTVAVFPASGRAKSAYRPASDVYEIIPTHVWKPTSTAAVVPEAVVDSESRVILRVLRVFTRIKSFCENRE